jgi:hypothetical protein
MTQMGHFCQTEHWKKVGEAQRMKMQWAGQTLVQRKWWRQLDWIGAIPLDQLISLEQWSRSAGIRRIRCQWWERGHDADELVKSGYTVTHWATCVMPLSEGWEKRIHRSARKNLKRLASLDLSAHTVDAKAFHRCLQLRRKPPLKVFLAEEETGCYRFYVARHAGQPAGTLGVYIWKGVATEIASTRSDEAIREQWPVQDLLHWHAMTELQHEVETFHLAGYNPAEDASPKEKGIRQFKRKWGPDEEKVLVLEKAI